MIIESVNDDVVDRKGMLPKVSVCVMTYNQERYIRQCLQSIVDQKTDFAFEVIVADDCSTDQTPVIIREFADNYPGIVIPVLHERKVGVALNYRSAHDLARGEYVAHCDGDDLWLQGKLAFQADLLDKNPEASQCWTCAYLIDDAGRRLGIFPSRVARLIYPSIITAKDIAISYALVGQHSTQMYRRKFKFNFDVERPTLDFWIAFNMALNGPAIYSKKILSAYRMTSSPSLTRTQSRNRVAVDILAMHLADIVATYPQFARSAKSNMFARLLFSKLRGHDIREILRALEGAKNVRIDLLDFVRSVFYFLLQKAF